MSTESTVASASLEEVKTHEKRPLEECYSPIPKYAKSVETEFQKCKGFVEEDAQAINYIRCLSARMVAAANSGHPGAPMGCAAVAHALYGYVMSVDGSHPEWPNRDRFVLSNGHACALLYSMLYLSGFPLQISDLQSFRQLDSKCPGHPEVGFTPGVEVTTGPLGQGIATAVGLALGTRMMGARYGEKLFNNKTYVLMGDGCLQEGISAEACSLAGTLKLGNLIALYDRNGITIDGSTDLSFTDDTAMKFRAWGWQVMHVADGDRDLMGLVQSLEKAKQVKDKPVLIIVDTTIGYGSKKQGTAKVHGAPLAKDDLTQLYEKCGGFTEETVWEVPEPVRNFYAARQAAQQDAYKAWLKAAEEWAAANGEDHQELQRRFEAKSVSADATKSLVDMVAKLAADAPRNTSQLCLQTIAPHMPELVGGSADLMESNKTDVVGLIGRHSQANPGGRYIHMGVREHAMCAITNGLYAYGGFKPFNSTFFNFYTYAWGSVRLAALSHFPVLHIATHDSFELGEDGPTHQPIETMALCRATPNLHTVRPGDAREVVGAYLEWMKSTSTPFVVCLARGKVPLIEGTCHEYTAKGAYVLQDFTDAADKPKVLVAGSGSELHIAAETKKLLEAANYNVRLVSMPSWSLFEQQPEQYRREVFPAGVRAALIEPFSSYGIERYFDSALSATMTSFGASAPVKDLRTKFGFTPELWAKKIMAGYSGQQ